MENIRNALLSIWSSKVRSLLTLLGVVIGVSSVTILISLGQGLKNDVSGLIEGFGTNIMEITPGEINSSSNAFNPTSFIAEDVLTIEDVEDVIKVDGVEGATPLSPINGALIYKDNSLAPLVFGVYSNFIDLVDIVKLEEGRIFNQDEENKVIIISPSVKDELFGEDINPIGKKVILKKNEFEVIGYFKEPKDTSILGGGLSNFNIIPFDAASEINGREDIFRITVKAFDTSTVDKVKKDIEEVIIENHGEKDFTVLTQEDMLGLFNQFLNLATTLVSAIAAISLIVGGIGIMNIMLVTVAERIKEIGLRKAVGATKAAIATQFLVEAIIITLIGGFIGLGVAYGVGEIVRTQTELTPVITIDIIALAMGISIFIGIIFGLWPALNAASKDPIEALRHE